MTNKELKQKLDDTLIQGIINIVKDPTIVNKKDQLQGLIFNKITDQYWDSCKDDYRF